MAKASPVRLSNRIKQFHQTPAPNCIMFCKPYRVYGSWDIGPGAVLDLSAALPSLVKTCRRLYYEDSGWFVGDVQPLFTHSFGTACAVPRDP